MLDRRERYEPGDRVIALFPLNAYRSYGASNTSRRATKMPVGEVVTVHGDGPEWGGLLVQWRRAHYIISARGEVAIAPQPHQVAWVMVNGQINAGKAERLQVAHDQAVAEIARLKEANLALADQARRLDQGRNEALAANRALQGRVDAALALRDEARAELAQALEIGKDAEGRLDYRRAEAESLRQQLDQANVQIDQVIAQRNALQQVMQGEQHLLKRALDYLEKVQGVMNDADQDFNFSGNYDPDV